MKNIKHTKGFTLVELTIVVAIIAILAATIISSFKTIQISGRDSKRVHDIETIRNMLSQYYAKYNQYPTLVTTGQSFAVNGITYLTQVPTNPTPHTDNGCGDSDYRYSQTSSGLSYTLTFCLGFKQDAIAAGTNKAIPEGIVAVPSWSCGQSITDLDGFSYTTVQIGTQCWMSQGLRSKKKPDGTCINGGGTTCANASSADNGLGRSCYSNTESNCTTNGALYTWDGAMNGSTTEGAQGICPSGWHIPSDTEQDTLDQFLKDAGQTCNAARNGAYDCSTAGAKLKTGGSSGFNSVMGGYREAVGQSTFSTGGVAAAYWSSTQSGTSAWYRFIFSTPTVDRSASSKAYGFSIRCVR